MNSLINKNLFLLFLLIGYLHLSSQTEVKLYYNDKWELSDSTKYNYYRICEIDENNLKFHGYFTDYLRNGQILMKGIYSNNKLQGEYESYYLNGQLESKGNYSSNFRFGEWVYYYNDGNLKQKVIFKAGNPDLDFKYNFSVIEYIDKDGIKKISNGSGEWERKFEEDGILAFRDGTYKRVIDKVIIKGAFNNGKKEGKWTIRYSHSKYSNCDEIFQKDTFISGLKRYDDYYGHSRNEGYTEERINKLPNPYSKKLSNIKNMFIDTTIYNPSIFYLDIAETLSTLTGKEFIIKNRNAGYAEGDYELQQLLEKSIKYPINSKEQGVEGTVYLNLLIDKTGKIKKIDKMNSLNTELDNEALRVINSIKEGWIPALVDGETKPSYILVPITFQIH